MASQKIVSDGTNEAYLEFTVPDWAKYAGDEVTVEADVYAGTTARVRLQVLDGVTTTNSDTVTNTNEWTAVSKAVTIGDAPTQLKVRAQITSGGAVTAYFQHIRLISGAHLWEMPIPQDTSSNFAYLNRVDVESSEAGVFLRLPDDYWAIHHASTPYLALTHNVVARNDIPMDIDPTLPTRRKLRLFGQESPTLPTADGDNLEALDEFVKAYCIAMLYGLNVPRTEKIPWAAQQLAFWDSMWKRLEAPVPRAPNSRAVRRVE